MGSSIKKKDDQEILDKILEGLRGNLFQDQAAAYAGVAEHTFYNWVREGKIDIDAGNETKLSKFVQAIRKIEADKAREHIGVIELAGEQSNLWTARAWILERRFRKHFSKDAPEINELTNRVEKLTELVEKFINPKKDASNA
jgi:hypothetical protein